MYSNNDYRYYLEHRLLTSGGYLSHHGVLGMKWGIRRYQSYSIVPRGSGEGGKETGLAKKKSKLQAKKAANSAKIAKYQKQLNTDGAKKRAAKAAKYKAKQDKLDAKAARARARLAKGKQISKRQADRIAKAEKYRTKVAKLSAKNDKYQAKIASLEYKNAKIDKKIAKTDTKIKVKEIKDKAASYQKQLNELDDLQSYASAMRASDAHRYVYSSTASEKAKFKGADSSKYDTRVKKLEGRYSDLAKEYNSAEKKTQKLLSDLNKESDLVYRVSSIERTNNFGGREKKRVKKDLNNKYGKDKWYDADYYGSSRGNHYTVKPKTEKRAKKYKYNSSAAKRRSAHTPIHTEVHYY